MSDNDELNKLMTNAKKTARRGRIYSDEGIPIAVHSEENRVVPTGSTQWSSSDNKRFVPCDQTRKQLDPGVYEIYHSNQVGVFFEKIPVLTVGLIEFPETNSQKVVMEIQKFWEREKIFKEYNLTHKRGIILWGPPGSGKSSTIQLIMRDVVNRGGVVIKFTSPNLFNEGIRKFREIQKDTPVVILMEDLDSILQMHSESEVLNILDGVNQIEKVVFLATTNYPELLGPRIINRPSRFDKRYKIGHPNSESRRIYFQFIIGQSKIDELKIDLDKWVKDTEGFSLAHLKELFTAVVILGETYKEAFKTLSTMKEEIVSSLDDDDLREKLGFK